MDEMFLYKIIILYMLDRIDEYTLTNTQLANFMQGHGLPNNFNMHEALSEMIELGFISVTTIRDTQHYKITNLGALKIVLGIKRFLLYWAFVIVFALLTGLVVNLIV